MDIRFVDACPNPPQNNLLTETCNYFKYFPSVPGNYWSQSSRTGGSISWRHTTSSTRFLSGKLLCLSQTSSTFTFTYSVKVTVHGPWTVDVVFYDFRKAFDKVPHKRLMRKFRVNGLSTRVYKFAHDSKLGIQCSLMPLIRNQ